MTDPQDIWKRAYASLHALKSNLPTEYPNSAVDRDTADLYSKQLDALASTGINIDEFRIPSSMLGAEIVLANSLTNEMVATGNTTLKLGYLKTKIDSLLTYFDLNTSTDDKPTIGFHV